MNDIPYRNTSTGCQNLYFSNGVTNLSSSLFGDQNLTSSSKGGQNQTGSLKGGQILTSSSNEDQNLTTSSKRGQNLTSSSDGGKDSSKRDDSEFTRISSPLQKQMPERPETNICIKTEPLDEFSIINENDDLSDSISGRNAESLSPSEQISPQQNIGNRPQSLIPLGNVQKKSQVGLRSIKEETVESTDNTDNDPSIRMKSACSSNPVSRPSILRALYEQPLYQLDVYKNAGGNEPPEKEDQGSGYQTVSERFEDIPAGSENPVLSGLYDTDNVPRYRKKKSAKKSKDKDIISSNLSLEDTPPSLSSSKEALQVKTFESGGRLVYSCDVCNRELSHLTSYRRHMKLHTMERPHKCPVCSKGFIRKYHCLDHLNKHHKGVIVDPDSLLLIGESGLYTDQSDACSVSPGDYSYYLDQSLEGSSDPDQSMSTEIGIDQSASNILSELARSASKENYALESQNKSNLNEGVALKSEASKHDAEERKKTFKIRNPLNDGNEIEMNAIQDEVGVADHSESSQCDVTGGIKAIVAHLKFSRQKKQLQSGSVEHQDTP